MSPRVPSKQSSAFAIFRPCTKRLSRALTSDTAARSEPMESDLRYPVGKLQISPKVDGSQRPVLIAAIRDTPVHLASAVAGLNNAQLDTPYRSGGWTVRQVVHHVP